MNFMSQLVCPDSVESDTNTCSCCNAKHILWFLQDSNLGPFRLLHHVCFHRWREHSVHAPNNAFSYKFISKPDSCHVCTSTNCHSELEMCQIVGCLSKHFSISLERKRSFHLNPKGFQRFSCFHNSWIHNLELWSWYPFWLGEFWNKNLQEELKLLQ